MKKFALLLSLVCGTFCTSTALAQSPINSPIKLGPGVEVLCYNQCARPYEHKIKTVLGFEYNSVKPGNDTVSFINSLAEIKKTKDMDIREVNIYTHASKNEDWGVSEKRASAVKAALIMKGIDAHVINTVDYRKERSLAVCFNQGPACELQNSVVELVVLGYTPEKIKE